MTDKEHLNAIKELISDYENCYNGEIALKYARDLMRYHAKWIVEQTERVQELETIIEQDARQAVLEGLYEENKRYREQLKLIISDTQCKEHEYVSVRHLIRKRAEKALKGEE